MSFKHILRYGTSQEQRYLQEYAETYDMVAINANMMAHARSSIALFIAEKLVGKKPFFIDPLTHAFQHGSATLVSKKTSEMKSSIRKMCDYYGEPTKPDGSAVLPADFEDDQKLANFCSKVLKFQEDTVEAESKEVQKYLDEADLGSGLRPAFLIAPYFFMDLASYKEWLPINLRSIELCREEYPNRPVWAQIVISKDILVDNANVTEICEKYITSSPAGVLIWIDQFSEEQASVSELKAFKSLVNQLAEKVEVYNLYGGYWSYLLSRFAGLNGVAHGLEYGEERAVVPIGGGIPVSKFYYPSLHKRLKWSEAYNVLVHLGIITGDSGRARQGATSFLNEVCGCQTCRGVIGTDIQNFTLYGESKPVSFLRNGKLITMNYPLVETRDRCLRHYLWKKSDEREHVASNSPEQLLQELENAYKYEPYRRVLGLHGVGYLDRWVKSLQADENG